MPIDKGGRHIFTQRQVPYQASSAPIVSSSTQNLYFCEPSTFASECIIHLRGTRIKHNHFYMLEHGTTFYTLPFSGKVENISIYPDVPIYINDKHVNKVKIKDLNKDDKLSFMTLASDHPLYVEIHLRCPLIKNE